MLRTIIGGLLVFSLCLSAAPGGLAQAPDRIDHFRVLPRVSRVLETGGIAGVHHRYSVSGEFDFVRRGLGEPDASFRSADLIGEVVSRDPLFDIELDVDEAFSLNRLEGHALPFAAPFDVYGFRGETADGSRVRVFAAVLGPWMYLHGATRPPEGSADYFVYHMSALARSGRSGDFNGDAVVDARDYTAWRDSRRSDPAEALASRADLSAWREQYGERAPDTSRMAAMFDEMLAGDSAAAAVAAPEPAGMGVLALGCVLGWRRCRRQAAVFCNESRQ